MGFEWDPDKAAKNLIKHGVDFRDAVRIYSHPVEESVDNRHDYGEVRYISIGWHNDELLTVVSTKRGDNRRIISARRANEKEKRAYRQVQKH